MSCTTTPYSALVLPRRTRAPSYTCATGYEDRPNRVWFDRERAHLENELRRRCPLHYFLSKYDLSALLATLKQGADPALRDAAGRTPLDLAVQMAIELFETSLCTSFPVDNVTTSRSAYLASATSPEARKQGFTNPFILSPRDTYDNLNEQPNRMRYRAAGVDIYEGREGGGGRGRLIAPENALRGLGAKGCRKKYYAGNFPPHESIEYPRDADATAGAREEEDDNDFDLEDAEDSGYKRASRRSRSQGASSPGPSFPLPQGDITRFYASVHQLRPQQFTYAYDVNGKPASSWARLQREQSRLEQRHLQEEFLVVLEEFLDRPPSRAAMSQMRELIRRLNLLLSVVKKFQPCLPLMREAREKAREYIGTVLTYPYLYTAALHQAFKRYPRTPSGQVWDPLNPADSRRLVLIILSLKMRGHELFSFLGTVARLFNTFLDQLRLFTDPLEEEDPLYHQPSQGSSSSWLKLGSECSQFYLHFAFTLDEAGLFQKFISQQQLFERQDIFRWEDLLYTLMQHRDRFRPFFAALLARRLKARVQKRLVDTADRGDHVPEIVKYPCEERYFTRHLLGEYADIFGEAEAAEFSSMLRHWRYGAAREAKNERDSDFLSQGPILPPPLLPPNNSNTPGVSPASGAPAADFWS